jgi:hypothetical protein
MNKGMKEEVFSLISMFDMFSIPNSLVLGREITYQSKLSGFVSICMFLFLIALSSF